MSVLEKIGISYTGMNSKGESFTEILIGTIGFYYYSRLILLLIYIFTSTLATLYFFRGKEINFKDIAIIQVTVNLFVFLIVWVAFGNSFALIANPLLGFLLAGLLIYFLASKFRKPLIKQKAITL